MSKGNAYDMRTLPLQPGSGWKRAGLPYLKRRNDRHRTRVESVLLEKNVGNGTAFFFVYRKFY